MEWHKPLQTKCNELLLELKTVRRLPKLKVKRFQKLHGRLQFATIAIPCGKPILGQLNWYMSSAAKNKGRNLMVMEYLQAILHDWSNSRRRIHQTSTIVSRICGCIEMGSRGCMVQRHQTAHSYRVVLQTAPGNKRPILFGTAQKAIDFGVVASATNERIRFWKAWTHFVSIYFPKYDQKLPTLSQPEKIDVLVCFTQHVQSGGVSRCKQHVRAQTVQVSLRAITARFELDGERSLVVNSQGKYHKKIGQLIEGYRRNDPPPKFQLTVPLTVPAFMHTYSRSRTTKQKAMGDMALIAFYFLLRVGEYTSTAKTTKKLTQAFRIQDVTLWDNNTILDHSLPLDALLIDLNCTYTNNPRVTLEILLAILDANVPTKFLDEMFATDHTVSPNTKNSIFKKNNADKHLQFIDYATAVVSQNICLFTGLSGSNISGQHGFTTDTPILCQMKMAAPDRVIHKKSNQWILFYLLNTLIISFIFIKSMSLLRLFILCSQHQSNSAAICGKGMFRLI
jgi:hypothetical protein